MTFEKIFVDEEHYDDIMGRMGKEFAEAMQILYSNKVPEEYRLNDFGKMYEFMSYVYTFIKSLNSQLPHIAFRDLTHDLMSSISDDNNYSTEQDIQTQNTISKKLDSYKIGCILWSTHVYTKAKCKFDKKNENPHKISYTTNALCEFYDVEESKLDEECPLMKHR